MMEPENSISTTIDTRKYNLYKNTNKSHVNSGVTIGNNSEVYCTLDLIFLENKRFLKLPE